MQDTSKWLRSDEKFIEGSKKLEEFYANRLHIENNTRIKFIPNYRVINRSKIGKNKVKIVLVNLSNNFDVISIKVSRNASSMIADGSVYSIETYEVRTWYTLWLGKKQVHEVLGNIKDKKVLMVNSSSNKLSKEVIKEIQDNWTSIGGTR